MVDVPVASLAHYFDDEPALIRDWIAAQRAAGALRLDLATDTELERDAATFLAVLRRALRASTSADLSDSNWSEVKDEIGAVSRTRASRGFTPSETAAFMLSLKAPLFARIEAGADDPPRLGGELWTLTRIVDALALYSTEVHQRSREDIIRRQQQELLELSTPVIKLWEGIVAVPLIGTLDSSRTQVVMEALLDRIVQTNSPIAIIDITGVPTVDTLVAQHLLKTVAAARLMGADCIISGIRPQIAQTIVQLGVQLGDVATKATMADAVALALKMLSFSVVRQPAGA